MRILYVQERVNPGGSRDRLTTPFEQREIVIGRGGESQIIVASSRVSLVHAKIAYQDGAWTVSDLDSLVGVRVNNTRIASVTLKGGEKILIGDIEFSVSISGDELTLVQTISMDLVVSEHEALAAQAAALKIDTYLPRMRTISLVVAMIVFVGWGIIPLSSGRYKSWNSGPISNAHKTIERDCQKCHSEPLKPVQDKDCLTCHSMSEHAKGHKLFIAQHASFDMRCAECHMEHNGDSGLISKDSRSCESCHGVMQSLHKESSILNVRDFARHPQFRLSITQPDGTHKRVSLDDRADIKDGTPLKLNHAVHLKAGLRGPNGPVTLQCNACHGLSADERSIEPIAFDKHCRDCHTLGFDERLPDTQLPHGDAEAIYPTLFAEYARLLLLENGEALETQKSPLRAMPLGTELPTVQDLSPEASKVQKAARVAEEEVFTRTGCYLCHNYSEKPTNEQRGDETRYLITRPNVPAVWFTKARFDHGAHNNISCESCHEHVRKSTETSEVLLPGIETCRDCHVEGERPGYVRSDCAQCHVYHKALGLPDSKKQKLTDYLHSLTR